MSSDQRACLAPPPPSDEQLGALTTDPDSAASLRVLTHLETCEPCARRWAALEAAPPALAPGTTVGEYTLLAEVAAGGQGVVYRAHDRTLDRDVALKLSRSAISPESVERFRAEARAHAGLTHPHIAPLHSFGEFNDRPYFVMELARTNLADALTSPRLAPRTADEAALLVERLAEAVEYAHRAGIHHRDLKPQNVLLTFEGEPGDPRNVTAKLTDFGLAGVGALAGSPNYIAPEIAAAVEKARSQASRTHATTVSLNGDTTAYDGLTPNDFVRIDVYGLGAILHEVLTGVPPYTGNTPDEVLAAVADPAGKPALADPWVGLRIGVLPPTLRAIALECLARDPAERYPSAAAVADDLRRLREREPTRAYPKTRLARLAWRGGLWCWRRPAWAALLAVLLLLAVGGPVAAYQFYVIAGERDTQRGLAVDNARKEQAERIRADGLRIRAEGEERIAHGRASALALEKGLTLADQARPMEGLAWMVRALDLAPADDPIRDPILRNVSHWLHSSPRLQTFIPHDHAPFGLAFRPDGKRLYSCGKGGRLQAWDPVTGDSVGKPVDLPASVQRLLFDNDGKTLYAPGTNGQLYRFAANGEELTPLRTWGGHRGSILAIALTPDGRHVATGGSEGTLLVRETGTGKPVSTSTPHGIERAGKAVPVTRTIHDVAFSPDGTRVATAGGDGKVRVAGWKDGMEVLELAHEGPIPWAVCYFSIDRQAFIVAGDKDGVICVWDEKGERQRGPNLSGPITRLIPRPGERQGVLIAGYGEAARIWVPNTLDLSEELHHPKPVEGAAWSPDGARLATASGDGVRVWQFQPPDTVDGLDFAGLNPMEKNKPAGGSTVSPQGNRVAISELGPGGRVWAWNVAPSGVTALQGPPPQKVGILALQFSADATLLLLGGVDGSVRLWDFDKKRERWPTPVFASEGPKEAFSGAVRALAISPDGQTYAAGDSSGRVVLGSMETGVLAHTMRVAGTKPFDLRFSPDGKQLVVVSTDEMTGLLTWWDTATGKEIGPRRPLLNVPLAVDVSPDGGVVMVAGLDRRVLGWDMTTHESVGPEVRIPAMTNSVCFSPDGQLLLTAGSDEMARLWHMKTGRPVGPAFPIASKKMKAVFSRNSQRIVAFGEGLVSQRPLPAGPMAPDAVRRAVRLATGLEVGTDDRLTPISAADWRKIAAEP